MKWKVYYTETDPRGRGIDLTPKPSIFVSAESPADAQGRATLALTEKFPEAHVAAIVGPF